MERLNSRKISSRKIPYKIHQIFNFKFSQRKVNIANAASVGTTSDGAQLMAYLQHHWILKCRSGLRLPRFPTLPKIPVWLQSNTVTLCVLQSCKQNEKLLFSSSSSVLPQLRAKALSWTSVTKSRLRWHCEKDWRNLWQKGSAI